MAVREGEKEEAVESVAETKEERVARVLAERDAKEAVEREELEKHIAAVNKRVHDRKLMAAAAERKRQMAVFDRARKEPPRRKMYDDGELALKAQLPGPGAYNSKITCVNVNTGKTFSARKYDPNTLYNKFAGTPDDLRQRSALDEPSSVTYSPRKEYPRGSPRITYGGGVSFGVPSHLLEKYPGGEVPAAHDMSRMVRPSRLAPILVHPWSHPAHPPLHGSCGPQPSDACDT